MAKDKLLRGEGGPRRKVRGVDPSELGGLAPAGEVAAFHAQQQRAASQTRTSKKNPLWSDDNKYPVSGLEINTFTTALEKAGEEVYQWVLEVTKDFATEIFVSVVQDTPVLTGRAKANWQVSFNKAGTTSIPGPPYPDPIPVGLLTIEQVRKGQQIIIFNNVEYISLLDAGYSTQAPQGMTANAIAKASAKFGGYVDALDLAESIDDVHEGEDFGGDVGRGGRSSRRNRRHEDDDL